MMTVEDRLAGYVHDLEAATSSGTVPVVPTAPGGRGRVLGLVAVAVLVVVGVVYLTGHRDTDTYPASGSGVAFSFRTDRVTLSASDFWIDIDGTRFSPTGAAVDVSGDPGWSAYTTLELVWQEHGVEMRTNVYVTLTDTEWWVNEIRTYNGKSGDAADWVTFTGEFFRSPIGTPFIGSFDHTAEAGGVTSHLHLDGLSLAVTTSAAPPPGSSPQTTVGPAIVVGAPADFEQWYTAVKDTPDTVAAKFAVSVDAIAAANQWTDGADHVLADGDLVRVPAPAVVWSKAVRPYGTLPVGGNVGFEVGVGITNDHTGLCLLAGQVISGCDGIDSTEPPLQEWAMQLDDGTVLVYGYTTADAVAVLNADGSVTPSSVSEPIDGIRTFAVTIPTVAGASLVARDAAGNEIATIAQIPV